jgi:hypothetical protein
MLCCFSNHKDSMENRQLGSSYHPLARESKLATEFLMTIVQANPI